MGHWAKCNSQFAFTFIRFGGDTTCIKEALNGPSRKQTVSGAVHVIKNDLINGYLPARPVGREKGLITQCYTADLLLQDGAWSEDQRCCRTSWKSCE